MSNGDTSGFALRFLLIETTVYCMLLGCIFRDRADTVGYPPGDGELLRSAGSRLQLVGLSMTALVGLVMLAPPSGLLQGCIFAVCLFLAVMHIGERGREIRAAWRMIDLTHPILIGVVLLLLLGGAYLNSDLSFFDR